MEQKSKISESINKLRDNPITILLAFIASILIVSVPLINYILDAKYSGVIKNLEEQNNTIKERMELIKLRCKEDQLEIQQAQRLLKKQFDRLQVTVDIKVNVILPEKIAESGGQPMSREVLKNAEIKQINRKHSTQENAALIERINKFNEYGNLALQNSQEFNTKKWVKMWDMIHNTYSVVDIKKILKDNYEEYNKIIDSIR